MGCQNSINSKREITDDYCKKFVDLIYSNDKKRPIYFYIDDYYYVQIDKDFPTIININDSVIYKKEYNLYRGIVERDIIEIYIFEKGIRFTTQSLKNYKKKIINIKIEN